MGGKAAAGGELGRELVASMDRLTWDRYGDLAVRNAEHNVALLGRGQSLAALAREAVGEGDSAIVVAAGPSIRRKDPIKRIKESGFKGAIIATDSGMAYCLRNGVVPDLVVTLDPHATRIVRWFGDPGLTEDSIRTDDYYRRQDMDTAFANELAYNSELMGLLERHGHKIRIALCSASSETVVNRVLDIGMQVYWWNPMLDDPDLPDSISRRLFGLNRLPMVNAGGNVGSACWMMAHAVLGKKHVALTGMDFAYYGDTDYTSTQYYHEAVALVGKDNLDSIFMHVENPHLGLQFYSDPAYMWYRECFLDMVKDADCTTYNCTEGGILFGDGIRFIPLDAFLSERRS